jgi:lysozyme family protein
MSDFAALITFLVGDSETQPGGEEGGWNQNDPPTVPPGQNPTYRGISFDEWRAWRGDQTLTQAQFREMLTRSEIKGIVRAGYWEPSHAELLPFGSVLYADHVFNAGLGGWRTKSAAWCLQTALEAVGVNCGGADGVLGPQTTGAMRVVGKVAKPGEFIDALAAARVANYRTKREFSWAGTGWLRRVERCRVLNRRLAGVEE